MSRPNVNFLAQHFLIPNLDFSFALRLRDYRLLWGIFCGATANVSEIPIYTPEHLDVQLDTIMQYVFVFLSCLVDVLFLLFMFLIAVRIGVFFCCSSYCFCVFCNFRCMFLQSELGV